MAFRHDLRLELPFVREEKDLPARLPTLEEIQASTRFLKGAEAWADKKVVRVGDHFVVKYSSYNNVIEGENLLFIEKNLNLPAPKLYAMWLGPDEKLYLVMQYIPGITPEVLWPTLGAAGKDSILLKVKAALDKMRSLPSPDFFGSVVKGQLPFHLFYWPGYPSEICGPFQNERDLTKALILKSRLTAKQNERHSYLADFFDDQLLQALARVERASTFTHADIQRKNIIISEIDSNDADHKDFAVSIVDWELAGWYPCYWEYFSAFTAFAWDDDWPAKASLAIPAWPAETAMMKMIYQDLWM